MNSVNSDLRNLDRWAKNWLIAINPSKTVAMYFSPKRMPDLLLGKHIIELVDSHKHLGMWLTPTQNWTRHINEFITKCSRTIGILRKFKYRWNRKVLEICYKSFIRPVLEYGNILYDSCSETDSKKLEQLQIDAAHIVAGTKKGTSHERILLEIVWQQLSTRRFTAKGIKMFQIKNGDSPDYLSNIFRQFAPSGGINTRGLSTGNL